MVKGERFTRNGKTYEVLDVFGTNYSFREVEEVKKELPTFEEEVEQAIEAPKKKVVRRKKA